jgi:hypothetical protein
MSMLLTSQIERLARRPSPQARSTSAWNKVVITMATRIHQKRAARSDPGTQPEEWQQTLDSYRHKASLTLELHRPDGRNCAACGHPWPCNRAAAAEQMLEL